MLNSSRPRPHPPASRHLAACLACLALVWGNGAHAEIYKFVDDSGHVTYTNMPRPGAKKLDLGPSRSNTATAETKSTKKRGASANPTPDHFPRVDPGTQRKRDDMRRQLLVEELDSERRNLGAAQAAFTSGRRLPAAEQSRLMESVRLHEKNIEMLNKELGHLR